MSHYTLQTKPGRTTIVDGKECLFFSGYGYLGMAHVPAFAGLIKEGIDKYGWLHPSSRISNTQLALFEECEALLSTITGCEDTVLVSSGYTAGQIATEKWAGMLTNLQPSHPAIQTTNPSIPQGIYAVASVNVLTAGFTDINLVQPGDTQAFIIDDSHGIGLTGLNGSGAGSYLQRRVQTEYVFTYSLGKAFGINAGAISCSMALAAEYRKSHAYTASTAPSPAVLHAFIHGQAIYAGQRQKLQANIAYLQALLPSSTGVTWHPSLPIFVLPPGFDEQRLFKKNIIISSFAYPDKNGEKINRIVVNALHQKDDLNYLAACLKEFT